LGLTAGLAGAAAFSRDLESQLFRVGRYDALTFTAVAALPTVVALAASVVPALRAGRGSIPSCHPQRIACELTKAASVTQSFASLNLIGDVLRQLDRLRQVA
jgi:hypothetical protein